MRYWIVLFLFCLGIGPAVQAQNKGVVKGRVFDLASNEAIPFANVVVYGTTLGGATDEEGRFRLENVPPGLVRLEVSRVSVGYCRRENGKYRFGTCIDYFGTSRSQSQSLP